MTPAQEAPDLGRRLRRARRRMLFLGLRALLRVIGFGGIGVVGSVAGALQFHFARRQRRRIEHDMALALGRPPGDPAVRALLREAYRVNNTAVLETLAMFDRHLDEQQLGERCEIAGLDELRSAMAAGRGAILLATHAGNAALLPVKLAHAGWAVSVVYREARMMSAGFLQAGLERYGIEGILANTGLRAYGQMLAALKQGRIVFLMMDQGVRAPRDGLPVRFLGKEAAMPAGPSQLARAARAPLLPVVTTAARPLWHFTIRPPVTLGQGPIESDVETLARLTERQILDYPHLWSWHQRRWRKIAPGPVHP
ncbi:lysophospholipid acyltransferase family protein [Ramlibacter alkalitolerans]|uniref:Lysophospholipid acyltransferase family protein n=1 Tax=Ramlibacter alkalitolerans TaxID=2039631 RepID=A0ABS1JWP1_9BURK|nr:lysophospholipid acyltransferase family protein [Ramlibacter alkalitolerans]MBL0428516.1 lysophospholipid acyltransferase family protein [Ramlibacter alkalitolerans]